MLQDEDKYARSTLRYEHAAECLRAADALFLADPRRGFSFPLPVLGGGRSRPGRKGTREEHDYD